MKKRMLSLILAVAMVLALFPAAAFADSAADPLPSEELSELIPEEAMGAEASFYLQIDPNNSGVSTQIYDENVTPVGEVITGGWNQVTLTKGASYYFSVTYNNTTKTYYRTVDGNNIVIYFNNESQSPTTTLPDLTTYTITFNVTTTDNASVDGTLSVGSESVTITDGTGSIELSAGTYTYTMSVEGYIDASGSITVSEDATKSILLISSSYTEAVTFNVNPATANATLTVGGTSVVLTNGIGTANLTVGSHTYTATAEGFNDATASFDVTYQGTNTVNIELSEASSITTIGKTDYSSDWWTAVSEAWQVPVNSYSTFTIHSYRNTADTANDHNFIVLLADSAANVANYDNQLAFIRADNWDNHHKGKADGNTDCYPNYNWDTFLSDMNDITAKITVVNYGATVDVLLNMTTANGTKYYDYFMGRQNSNAGAIWFAVSAGKSYFTYESAPINTPFGTAIGNSSWDAGYQGGNSDSYTVASGKTVKMTFKNFRNANQGQVWDNFLIRLGNSSNDEAYAVFRADNYILGLGKQWSATSNGHADSGNDYKGNMEGADVTLSITNNGSSAKVRADIVLSNGNNWYEEANVDISGDLCFKLSLENVYLVNIKAYEQVTITAPAESTLKVNGTTKTSPYTDFFAIDSQVSYTVEKAGYQKYEDTLTVTKGGDNTATINDADLTAVYLVSFTGGTAGATVTVSGNAGSVVLDETGAGSLYLPAGTYTFTQSKTGYEDNTVSDVTISAAQTVTLTGLTAAGTMVGNEDNSSAFFGAFSATWQVPVGKTATMEFDNFSSAAENYMNAIVVLQSTAAADDTAYSEYAVLRTDNYGWKGALNTNDNGTNTVGWGVESNWDWDTFKTFTNGATVALTVTNYGTTADVLMTYVKGEETHFQKYSGIDVGDGSSLYFRLSVDHSHLVYREDPVIDYGVSRLAQSLLFEGKIVVRYYFNRVADGLTLEFSQGSTNTTVTNNDLSTNDTGLYYDFPVVAKALNETITLKAYGNYGSEVHRQVQMPTYANDGSYDGEGGKTYSVMEYAQNKSADENATEAMRNLAAALETYGTVAAAYFDDAAEVPAVNLDSVTISADLPSATRTTEGEAVLSGLNMSVMFKEDNAIRVYVTGDGIGSFRYRVAGNSAAPINSREADGKTYYYMEMPNIAAMDLDKVYTFELIRWDTNKTQLMTVTTSALGYAKLLYDTYNGKTTAKAQKSVLMAKALFNYSQMADAYAANN